MFYSEKDKTIYELRFDRYIRIIILGTFKNFLKAKKKYEDIKSLNDIVESGLEIIDLLVGDEDVKISDDVNFSNIEDLFSSPKYYKAMKPLASKEKLAVFLYYVCFFEKDEVANLMHYKDISSVNKLIKSAKEKVKKYLDKGEKKND